MKSSTDPIIRDLEIMADSVNYRKWIYDQIGDAVGDRVIELGAGTGNFTELLTDRDAVVAVDVYGPAVERMEKKFSGVQNVIPLRLDIEGPELSRLKRYKADTIVCINVLEHIRDDGAALSGMFNILEKGGRLALLVPAFQFLFGSIDRVVGHYRRYGRNELSRKLSGAGFEVRDLKFMNFVAVPGWYVNNRVLKRREESTAQVKLFDKFIVPWLKEVEHAVHPPFGLSLVAIGEKK